MKDKYLNLMKNTWYDNHVVSARFIYSNLNSDVLRKNKQDSTRVVPHSYMKGRNKPNLYTLRRMMLVADKITL